MSSDLLDSFLKIKGDHINNLIERTRHQLRKAKAIGSLLTNEDNLSSMEPENISLSIETILDILNDCDKILDSTKQP